MLFKPHNRSVAVDDMQLGFDGVAVAARDVHIWSHVVSVTAVGVLFKPHSCPVAVDDMQLEFDRVAVTARDVHFWSRVDAVAAADDELVVAGV